MAASKKQKSKNGTGSRAAARGHGSQACAAKSTTIEPSSRWMRCDALRCGEGGVTKKKGRAADEPRGLHAKSQIDETARGWPNVNELLPGSGSRPHRENVGRSSGRSLSLGAVGFHLLGLAGCPGVGASGLAGCQVVPSLGCDGLDSPRGLTGLMTAPAVRVFGGAVGVASWAQISGRLGPAGLDSANERPRQSKRREQGGRGKPARPSSAAPNLGEQGPVTRTRAPKSPEPVRNSIPLHHPVLHNTAKQLKTGPCGFNLARMPRSRWHRFQAVALVTDDRGQPRGRRDEHGQDRRFSRCALSHPEGVRLTPPRRQRVSHLDPCPSVLSSHPRI